MNLAHLIVIAPVLLFSVIVHEVAHGWAALRLGDPTAQRMGRLTLNPLPHIDPFMTILLPALLYLSGGVVFGGAKPVPFNPWNLRHVKRDSAIIAAAGPLANLLLVAGAWVLLWGLHHLGVGSAGSALVTAASLVLQYAILINIVLAWFNLLPIPPLDGSKVAAFAMSDATASRYLALGRYGFLILVALIYTGFLRYWMAPIGPIFDTITHLAI